MLTKTDRLSITRRERSEEIGNTEKQKRKYSLVGKEAQLPFIKLKEMQKYKYCEGRREAQLT